MPLPDDEVPLPDDEVTDVEALRASVNTLGEFLTDLSQRMVDVEEGAPSQNHYYDGLNFVGRATHPLTGMSLRALITIILVAAVIATVAGGMIAGTPPGEMTQYVAPISSLASLALGYWFGTEKSP
jgi:hypothetical protein